jgi:hypothetical protein
MEVKRMGMLAVSVRKMKILTVKLVSTKDEDGESDMVKVDRCCILTLSG